MRQTQTILVVVYWSLHRRKEQLRLPVANRFAIVVKQEALYQAWICLSVSSVRKEPEKNKRKHEELIRCTWECTLFSLVNAVRIRQDQRVLLEAEHAGLHAKDVQYHSSCYKKIHVPQAAELACKKAAGRRKLHSTECL